MNEKLMHEKLDRIAEDSAATRANLVSLEKYIGAVSSNQKATDVKLQEHMLDTSDAHGAKASSGQTHLLIELGMLISTVVLAAFTFWRHG